MKTIYLMLLKRVSAAACCLAAVYSFLMSGFFGVLSQWLAVSFATERIPLLLGLDLGSFMRLGLLFIIGFYTVSLVSSEEVSYAETLGFCLVLYMPEALSLSEVNWLNALGLAPISTLGRPPWAVLVTGAIILNSYIIYVVLSELTDTSGRYLKLAVEPADVEASIGGQLRFMTLFGIISVAALITLATFTSSTSSVISGVMSGLPSKHVIYGALGVAVMLAALAYYTSRFTKGS